MAAATGGDIRAGIGPRLRAAREKKGLSILQAAERLHVDSRLLESLEAEDFAALGAPVYARGHLRHYAELVGESPTELQALYADATKAQPAQPDLTRIARGEPQDDSRRLAGPALIGVIAVAVLGLVWWVINLSGDKVPPAPPRSAVASSPVAAPTAAGDDTNTTGQAGGNQNPVSQPAPAEARAKSPVSKSASPRGNASAGLASAAPGGAHPSTSGSPPAARSGAPGGATPANSGPRKTSANVASTTPVDTASPARVAAATPATNTAATAPNPTSRAKDGELTLRFSSDSWAEVYDASGQRLFYDVGAASSAHTMKGLAPLRVVLGNAAGVAVEYNGRPALVPASNQADGSTRFVINARGRAVAASATASDGD
jgi:cytoskeleton protein RodZ